MTLKSNVKLEEKLTLGSKNGMRSLVNFNASSGKSKNLHFDVVLLLPIAYEISTKIYRKDYLSWHWKKIKALKKNWLFVWKMTWGIWWTLMQAVEGRKTLNLMDLFCRKYGRNVFLDKSTSSNFNFLDFPLLV